MTGKEKMSGEIKTSLPPSSSPQPAQPNTHGEEEKGEKEEGRLPSRPTVDAQIPLPRVTIKFCTQCKWMLRAAYYAQELLSTFSTSLGEVALQPSTGGVFVVQIHHVPPTPEAPAPLSPSPAAAAALTWTLWDRKVDGGFPETKELKRRLRDIIEPGRNLGHVDRDYPPRRLPASTPAHDATDEGVGAGAQQESISQPAELSTPSRPRPSPEATAPSAAERIDLAHHAAVSMATGEAGSEPKCEDCQ